MRFPADVLVGVKNKKYDQKKKYHKGDLMSECVQMNLRSLGESAEMGNTFVTIRGGNFFSSIVRPNSCHSSAKQFRSLAELLNLVRPNIVFHLHERRIDVNGK